MRSCVSLAAFAGVAALSAHTGAQAQNAERAATPRALAYFDQSPIVAVYGLPRAAGYSVAAAGHWRVALWLDHANSFQKQSADGESLLLDGATTRATLGFGRGLGDGWQASIEIPFVAHSGGFADGFLDDFHETFDFADDGRADGPRGRQRYRYTRHGRRVLDVSDSPSGIGDVRVAIKKRLAGWGAWGSSVAVGLKLPSGDPGQLTGSGSVDVAGWAAIGNNQDGRSRWRVLAGAGGVYTGKGDILARQRVQTAGFGWLMLGYALTRRFVAKTQVYAHSPLYHDTRLKALDGTAVSGALGFAWRATRETTLSLATVEDLNVGASPDLSVTLGLRHAFTLDDPRATKGHK